MEQSSSEKYYTNLHHSSYEKLLDLAEMYDEDKSTVHCDVAMKAMERIFKCGSCHDAAEGLKYYVNLLHSHNEMVQNN